MSIKQKFFKLRRDPNGFIRDFAKKRIGKYFWQKMDKGNVSTKIHTKKINNLKIFKGDFNFDWLIKQLKLLKIQKVVYYNSNSQYEQSIAILKQDISTFIKIFLDIINSHSLLIHYLDCDGKRKNILTVSEFRRLCETNKFIYLRLYNPRVLDKNNNRIWFYLQFCEYSRTENCIIFPRHNHISVKLWNHIAEKYGFFKKDCQDYESILKFPLENNNLLNIDAVYTWVNFADENWQKLYQQHTPNTITDASSKDRFFNRDELKYSLRSIAKFANFVNNIYIVSNCSPPEWLNLKHSKIKWIFHEEIIPQKYLPTFSSHAIECCLHHISNLSENFIYMNDDVYFTKFIDKSEFIYSNGILKPNFEKYGNITDTSYLGDYDYLNASRNSNKIIENEFRRTATNLHTHSPHILCKSVLTEIETKYNSFINQTLSNKFRNINDINLVSYLHHHYAFNKGKAIYSDRNTLLITTRQNYAKRFENLFKYVEKGQEIPYVSVCINDGGNSSNNKEWNDLLNKFFNIYFPEKSEFEV